MIINGIEVGPGVILEDVDLSGANLEGVDLSRSRLVNVNLEGANLRNATLGRWGLDSDDFSSEEQRKKYFRSGRFSGVNLRGADLTGARLYGQKFFGCDLTDANLAKCLIWDTRFRHCDMKKSSFKRARIGNVSFTHCDLDETNFSSAGLDERWLNVEDTENGIDYFDLFPAPLPLIQLWNYDGIYLANFKITESTMRQANFKESHFETFDFLMVDCTGTNFTESTFRGIGLWVDLTDANFSNANCQLFPQNMLVSNVEELIDTVTDIVQVRFEDMLLTETLRTNFLSEELKRKLIDTTNAFDDLTDAELQDLDREEDISDLPAFDRFSNGLVTEILDHLLSPTALVLSNTNFSHATIDPTRLLTEDATSCNFEGAEPFLDPFDEICEIHEDITAQQLVDVITGNGDFDVIVKLWTHCAWGHGENFDVNFILCVASSLWALYGEDPMEAAFRSQESSTAWSRTIWEGFTDGKPLPTYDYSEESL